MSYEQALAFVIGMPRDERDRFLNEVVNEVRVVSEQWHETIVERANAHERGEANYLDRATFHAKVKAAAENFR